MSDELLYNLTISVERNTSIDSIEEKLEDLLLDLYNVESVEGIKVADRTPPIDENVDELERIVADLDSDEIRKAIELVRELESFKDE